ncbi:MAG: hypothetical protein WKF77_27150, partial [Planctomycetaceae bacterium]
MRGEGGGGAEYAGCKARSNAEATVCIISTAPLRATGRPASNSSAAGSKPAMPVRRSTSTPDGTTSGARSGAPARPKSKQTTRKSGTGGDSRPPKRPTPDEPTDYDDDYESGYESGSDDPWSSGPSWEEPNPYAAPTSQTSPPRSRKATGGGNLRLAGIGLLVQAWSYIGIIAMFFSLIAIGFIGAVT